MLTKVTSYPNGFEMFASLGQTFLNIIAPLPEDDEDAENEEEEVLEAEEAKNLESKREEKEMNHSLSLSHQEPTMPTQSVKSLQKTQVAETNKSEKWKQCFELLEEATELVDVPLDEEDNIDTNDDASRAPMPSNTSESPSNTSELPSNPQILPPVSAHPPNKFEMVKTGNAESANETPPQLLIPPKVTSPSPLKPAAEKLLSPSHSSEDIGPLADPQSKDCSVLLDLEKALRDLQMSEEALREAEHISWQRKAEASELLFALELEQNSNAELKRTVHSLEQRVKDEVTQNESSPQAVVVVQPSMELSPIIQRLLRGLSVQSTSVDLGENLSLLEKNLNYLVERMETLEREVENWKEATSFRDHKISSLESDLLAVNTELSNSQMNGRASDTGAILKEYEAEIESLRSERERLLSTRETSSGPYALDVQRLEGQIKTLECTNNALLNELETKERLLKSHQEQASQRASECERLREAADVLKGLQSSKDAELLKVKRDLDDAQKVLAEQNVSLHQLKQQLQK